MKKVFSLVLILVGCSAQQRIVGTWTSQKTVLGVVTQTQYVFREDGTGIRTTLLDVDFTYTVEGEKLYITTEVLGIESKEEYIIEFKGDSLILMGQGETVVLEKAEG